MDVWPAVPECEGNPLHMEVAGTGVVSLAVMLDLEERIGADEVRLLLHLVYDSYSLHGRRLVQASASSLEQSLRTGGKGWTRQAIMPRLRRLKELGLLDDAGKGLYELNPQLVGPTGTVDNLGNMRSRTGRQSGDSHLTSLNFAPTSDSTSPVFTLVSDTTGPALERTGTESVPVPRLIRDVDANAHDIGAHKHNLSPVQVEVVVAELERFGCQGKMLNDIRRDPVRAVAWWLYAREHRRFDPNRYGPPLINSMLLSPSKAKAWPDGLSDADRPKLRIQLEAAGPALEYDDGRRWTPTVSAPVRALARAAPPGERQVTVGLVETAMIDAEPGQLAPADDPCFAQDVDMHIEQLRRTLLEPSRIVTVAKLRALQDRGRLVDAKVPDSWWSVAQAAF